MNCGIYSITSPSGNKYIGSAVNFKNRWKKHLTELRNNKHGNHILQKTFNKYKEDNLIFSKLLVCAPRDLLMYEQRAIDIFKPEYNICKIANSPLGIKRREDRKAIRSNGQIGRKHSEETKNKIRSAALGRKRTEQAKQKTSESLRKIFSTPEMKIILSERAKKSNSNPETRKKISLALKGITKSEETKLRMSKAQVGHISKSKGIPRTEEVKLKISLTKQLNKINRMKNGKAGI